MTSEMGWENWYLRFIIIVPLVVAGKIDENQDKYSTYHSPRFVS